MAVAVYTPQKQRVVTGQSEGSSSGRNIGSIVGLVGGAALAAAAIPTGGATLPLAAAALGGAGGGAGLGGLVGGMFDKKPSEGAISTVNAASGGIPISDSAMNRRMAYSEPASHLDTLGEGLASIARVNDPGLTQMALPSIYQAYTKAYDQQGRA